MSYKESSHKSKERRDRLSKYIIIILFIPLVVYMVFLLFEYDYLKNEPFIEKDLVYIEKYSQYGRLYLMFESIEDEKYYGIKVSGWDYDHVNLNSNENLKLQTKGHGNFKEVLFVDEWTKLREINNYAKTK
ncbi:hypothetical protein [Lysinibacillus sphaericus]|uniref:hypothetical protein n=1 Tax=Lysinibacillus sphaericus TaxID=1421 RepID=UPI001A9CFEB6|nr:hypothetical protein [Lysinibacillus sphaericus]QTB28857.1 hypothetical protein J2D51_09760 [Lysinibacillus sphaericus]